MRVSVVGGSGFIGTELVGRLLEAGHVVTILDKVKSIAYPEICQVGDVRCLEDVLAAFAGIDAVYNLAAEHRDDVSPESLYFDVNVGGARNVCEAARRQGIQRMVFTSSVALYGLNAGRPGEESPARPFNAYGHSKYDAEVVYRDWAEQDSARSLTIVRPVVVFGENNRGNVFNLLRQIHQRHFIMVGRGANRKSMAYVKNVADFLAFALTMPAGINLYNYADSPDLETRELVTIARQAFGMTPVRFRVPYWVGLAGGLLFDGLAALLRRTFSISAVRVRKFCAETTVSTERLAETVFRPRYTLTEGLRETIHHEFMKGREGTG